MQADEDEYNTDINTARYQLVEEQLHTRLAKSKNFFPMLDAVMADPGVPPKDKHAFHKLLRGCTIQEYMTRISKQAFPRQHGCSPVATVVCYAFIANHIDAFSDGKTQGENLFDLRRLSEIFINAARAAARVDPIYEDDDGRRIHLFSVSHANEALLNIRE